MPDLPIKSSDRPLAPTEAHRWISAFKPARPGLYSRLRKYLLLAALAIIAAASFGIAAYYLFIASDQFVAEARFTVRAVSAPKLDTANESEGAPMGLIVQDTQVVMSYLESRALVEYLQKEIDLRHIYSNDSIDFLSRMAEDAKIETFVRYWKSMVDVSVQPSNGIVTLSVKAFSASDSTRIALACIKASESVINNLNKDVIADSVTASNTERQIAEGRLTESRAKLEQIRNKEAVITTEQSEMSSTQLISKVRSELLSMQQEYETQSRYLAKTAPQSRTLQARIEAAKAELEKLKAQQTHKQNSTGVASLSESFLKIESATLEAGVAAAQYASALSRLENARLAAQVKLLYVEVFMPPDPPQRPKYPHRVLMSSLSGAFGLLSCFIAFITLRRMRA